MLAAEESAALAELYRSLTGTPHCDGCTVGDYLRALELTEEVAASTVAVMGR